jgi:integrase/recombinase XerD
MARPKGSKRPGIKYLSATEWQRFVKAIKEDVLYDFLFNLMFAVGGRVTEITNLRLSAVDQRARHIQVQGVKGGLLGMYRMDKALWRRYRRWMVERARQLGVEQSPHLFPSQHAGPRAEDKPLTEQAVKDCFKRITRDLGLNPELSVHSIRHTAAISLLRAGVSASEIQEHLRQHTSTAVMQYLRLFGTEAQQAAERRAEVLSGLSK